MKTPTQLSYESAKYFLAAVKKDLASARAAVKHERQNLVVAKAALSDWALKVKQERLAAKAERQAKVESRKATQIAKLEAKLAKIREAKTPPVGLKKMKADRRSSPVKVINPESAVA